MKNPQRSLLILFVLLVSQRIFAQDSLYMNDGKFMVVKVLELDNNMLKYKKFSNIEGPTYTVEKAKVKKVRYLNGDEELFSSDEPATSKEVISAKSSSGSTREITTRGNNVFIKIDADELSGLSSEVKNMMHEWNYWHVVLNPEEADFILQITTLKKGMTFWTNTSVSSKAIVLTKSGNVIWESEYFKATTSMYNGYNSLHSSLKKLFGNGLKKQFK